MHLIFHVYAEHSPTGGIKTKIAISGDLADVINRVKFSLDRSRGFSFTGGSKIACSHRKAESSLAYSFHCRAACNTERHKELASQ
jgi:hypothetical protein